MLRRVLILVLVGGALLLFAASCSSDDSDSTNDDSRSTSDDSDSDADTPVSNDVTIVWGFDGNSAPYAGDVSITGGAVDAGLVCAEARGVEKAFEEIESDADSATFRLDTRITCDDESGVFVVRDDATLLRENGVLVAEGVTGTWDVISGTGDYEELTGSGDSTNKGSSQVTKTYTGELSLN